MTLPTATPNMMMVAMRETTVALLMAHRLSADDTLDRVVERLAARKEETAKRGMSRESADATLSDPAARGIHRATVLGMELTASTLGRLFAEVVDAVHDVDPDVIERLAMSRARTRRFVSREKVGVHPGRQDLGVVQTRSGWWVSANVGELDVVRCLKALCQVALITFGDDIVFPVRPGGVDCAT